MAQIQAGESYDTGDQVTAANLNNHVNGAVLLPGAILDQPEETSPNVTSGGDVILIYDTSTSLLKKAKLFNIFSQEFDLLKVESILGKDDTNIDIRTSGSADIVIATDPLANPPYTNAITISANGLLTLGGESVNISGNTQPEVLRYASAYPQQLAGVTTSQLKLPWGTTSQRPTTSPIPDDYAGTSDVNVKLQGTVRYNTQTKNVEYRTQDTTNNWKTVATTEYVDTASSQAGPKCKVMAVYNGQTLTLQNGYNVTSITSTPGQAAWMGGQARRITFTTPFANTNYGVSLSVETTATSFVVVGGYVVSKALTYVDVIFSFESEAANTYAPIAGTRAHVMCFEV
jgi:hypothetical protein